MADGEDLAARRRVHAGSPGVRGLTSVDHRWSIEASGQSQQHLLARPLGQRRQPRRLGANPFPLRRSQRGLTEHTTRVVGGSDIEQRRDEVARIECMHAGKGKRLLGNVDPDLGDLGLVVDMILNPADGDEV